MRLALLLLASAAFAQSSERILSALEDRALAEHAAQLKTDDRISMYGALVKGKPDNLHYQVLLASAYVQKTRETTDYSYLDRATSLLNRVLANDAANYEALRVLTATQLERHLFADAAASSRKLIGIAPSDPWNWGTLGDALIEIGDYDAAADAYQKMVSLRPDLASYNRAAHYRFLVGDVQGAIKLTQMAIDAGSSSPENVAWCLVDLGNLYLKTGQLDPAQDAFQRADRAFRNYAPAYFGLGKVFVARGEYAKAIEQFRRAQAITPLPDYAAALYDCYQKTGQNAEAAKQMQLIELIDHVSRANGEKANRNLALIFADHGVHLDRSLELARNELKFRRDIYSYDALAWALYRNGQHDEARDVMKKALALDTPEPAFQHHAQLIGVAR